MSIFPGLCGDLAVTPYRLFLGALPALAVEERLQRQLQSVFPWFTSRKRTKEQANSFMEIDLASCDAELLLRYTHVYYVRRQLYNELIDKQLTLIETGKAVKPTNDALLLCLTDGNAHIAQRLQLELHILQQAKSSCTVPNRRELAPDAPLEPYDYLCMMRVVEEDVSGLPSAEMEARSFLPLELVEAKAKSLAEQLLGGAGSVKPLDKKEQKLLHRMIPGDYNKVGCVEKLRPVDVATYYRFFGERMGSGGGGESSFFRKSLWAHVFRKFATHPAYLSSISCYWARHSGLDTSTALSTMPMETAEAVCLQQGLFPALKYRAQYLYSSPDVARQQWRIDSAAPLMRLFPLLGAYAAEDLAAAMAVEGEWARLAIPPGTSPLQEGYVRALREFAEQTSSMYENNMDAALKRVEEGVKVACPPLREDEVRMLMPNDEQETPVATAAASAAQS